MVLQFRWLGEVVAKLENFDGLGEVLVLTWKLLEFEGSVICKNRM